MYDFVRVRDIETGHIYSIVAVDEDRHERLKDDDDRPLPAVDIDGRPLPAELHIDDDAPPPPDPGDPLKGALVADYDQATNDALTREIERRNTDRPEDLQIEVPKPGNKAELVAALTDDDRAAAAAMSESSTIPTEES